MKISHKNVVSIFCLLTISLPAFSFDLPRDESIPVISEKKDFYLPQDEDKKPLRSDKNLVDYDSELYNLSCQTFLANKNLTAAFNLAKEAVRHKPESLKWRKRYAQVSLWLGYGAISLKQWMILIKRTKNPAYVQEAIKVAKLTFDYQKLIKLYQYELDQGMPVQQAAKKLAHLFVELGEPRKALSFLKKHKPSEYGVISKLEITLGQLKSALKNLQAEEKKNGFSLQNTMQQANVLATMNRSEEAFKLLKKASTRVKATNEKYWDLLGILAWNNEDDALALIAYERLYAIKDKDELVLMRLGWLLRKVAPQRSLQLALKNWKLRPTPANLYNAASMSYELGNTRLFYKLFHLFPPYEREKHADLYIEWALAHNEVGVALGLAKKAKHDGLTLPAWLNLGLAMRENDHVAIEKYMMKLQATAKSNNYDDLSSAAYRIGHIQASQQWAYQALEARPDNAASYENFRNVMLPHSNFVSADVDYHQNGPISGFEQYFRTRYFMAPSFYVEPFVELWQTHSNDKVQIINVPKGLNKFGASFGLQQKRSRYLATINLRQAVRNFIQAKLGWQHQWDRFISSDIDVRWQENAEESTAMLVGAKKNTINGGATYRITNSDSMTASVSLDQYHSQDNVHFGDGQVYRLSWLHRFFYTYPDWNVNTYVNVNRYHNNGRSSALIDNLFPLVNEAGLLPRSYYEVGMSLGVGQAYRESYTKDFRPFGEIGVFQHSNNGFGQVGTIGIAGAVFGRDHLALYANFSRGQETVGQIDYSVGLEYDLYY